MQNEQQQVKNKATDHKHHNKVKMQAHDTSLPKQFKLRKISRKKNNKCAEKNTC